MRKVLAVIMSGLLCACALLAPVGARCEAAYALPDYTEDDLLAEGYDTAQAAVILSLSELIEAGEYGLEDTIKEYTSLSKRDISDYVDELLEQMAQKTTYERLIEGSGLSASGLQACRDELQTIMSAKSEVAVQLNGGSASMTKSAWNSLVSQATELQTRAADLALTIAGSELSQQEAAQISAQLDTVLDDISETLLNIAYSRGSSITQNVMDEITEDLVAMGNISVELNLIMQEKRMGPEPTPAPTAAPTKPPLSGAAAQNYEAFIARSAYITEKMNDPTVKSYMLAVDESAIAHIDIPAGWYEVCYMGDTYMTAGVDTGMMYSSGRYPLVDFNWNAEDGTLYDVYMYPICPGFTVS
ncbi:MAG: hypothetical protein IKS52_06455, partial [Clostridia bacterium]|nr:hypothetical protein [Clostridia bacterium]